MVVRVKLINTTPQLQLNFTIVVDLLFSLLENNPIFALQKNKSVFVQYLQYLFYKIKKAKRKTKN